MRLSDIKGKRTMEVLAEIVEPIANIAADPEAADLFQRKTLPEGMGVKEFVIQRLRSGLPALLRRHKNDLMIIMSTLEGVDLETYAEGLDLGKLLFSLADLITDEVFAAFFTYAQTIDSSSTSAQENTEE